MVTPVLAEKGRGAVGRTAGRHGSVFIFLFRCFFSFVLSCSFLGPRRGRDADPAAGTSSLLCEFGSRGDQRPRRLQYHDTVEPSNTQTRHATRFCELME